MPYKIENDGRYEVWIGVKILTKTNDLDYAIEVNGNNQGSEILDTEKPNK